MGIYSQGLLRKLIKSTNNGISWSNVDSQVSYYLNSIAFGNNKFVGVGSRTVIVSSDNGSNFTQTLDNTTFQDVTFGNGIFVAVGSREIIYTSTDGDTWTKVHP